MVENRLVFRGRDYLNVGEQPLAGSTLRNWVKVLAENKFDIDWQFIPRALYVSLMILVLSPFRFKESLKYDKKLLSIEVKKPIFIIGHWRSGTTFLHYLMGQDPNLAYVSTFATMAPSMILGYEDMFKPIVHAHLPSKRPMDDLEMKTDLPYEEEYAIANLSPYSFHHAWYFPRRWREYFDRYVLFKNVSDEIKENWKKVYLYFLRKISYKYNGRPILLKSLVNTARIPMLLELFPDARFIFISRNPYKVYLSTWKLYKSIIPIFSFQHISSEKLDEDILYCYKSLFQKYLIDRKLIPNGNLVEITYEDFVKKPLETLQSLYTTFDIKGFEEAKPFFDRYIKAHDGYTPQKYEIDETIKEKIYREWRFAFDAFGYKP